MNNQTLFNLLSLISIVVFTIIATRYILPSLKKKNWPEGITPLLLLHAFRHLPMLTFAPGQVQENLPPEVQKVLAEISYGDLVSAILAIAVILLLSYKATRQKIFVWIFIVVSLGDLVFSLIRSSSVGLLNYGVGFNAQIVVLYMPALLVSYFLMIQLLRKQEHS